MKHQSLKIFVQLLESIVLTEASTALKLTRQNPLGSALIKYAHQNRGLPDNLNWQQVDPQQEPFDEGVYKKTWYLFESTHGVALMEKRGRDIILYYWVEGRPKVDKAAFPDWTMNQVLKYLKDSIGEVKHLYKAAGTEAHTVKRMDRLSKRYQPPNMLRIHDMIQSLLKRFTPLWISILEQTIADVKGVVATLLKHDAHDRLRDKLNTLERLHTLLDLVKYEREPNLEKMERSLHNALVLTASHFFPEHTGTVWRSHSEAKLNPEKQEGEFLVLDGIEKNDRRLLSAVLAYMKKEFLKP